MKKLISLSLMACLLGSLSACDSSTGLATAPKEQPSTEAPTGSFSKAQFLKVIECNFIKDNPSSGKQLFEAYKPAVDSIPDANWSAAVAASTGITSIQNQYDAAVKKGCSA